MKKSIVTLNHPAISLLRTVHLSAFFIVFSVLVYAPLLVLFLNKEFERYSAWNFIGLFALSLAVLWICQWVHKKTPRSGAFCEKLCAGLACYLLVTITFFPMTTGALDGLQEKQNISELLPHISLVLVCLAGGFYAHKMTRILVNAMGLVAVTFSCVCLVCCLGIELMMVQRQDSQPLARSIMSWSL